MKTKTPNNKKCKGGIYITSAKEWEEFIAKYNHFGGSLYVSGTGLTSLTFPSGMSIGGYLYVSGTGLTSLTFPSGMSIGGSLDVSGTGLTSLTFPSGMSIGGYLYVRGTGLTSLTFPSGMSIGGYQLNDVEFDKKLFMKVFYGQLSAKEVFTLRNMEQRRVAYERMDKLKMKELPDYNILHEVADDGHGYPMKIVSFTMPGYGYDTPFYFLNCFCPSEGREYFLETRQTDCWKAKARSFGFDSITFDEEW